MKRVAQFTILFIFILLIIATSSLLNERNRLRQSITNLEATAVASAVQESAMVTTQNALQKTAVAVEIQVLATQEAYITSAAIAQEERIAAEATSTASVARQAALVETIAEQRPINQAYELVAVSHQLRGEAHPDVEQSTQLALEAVQLHNDINTRYALQESLAMLPQLDIEMDEHHPGASELLFNDDGSLLLSSDNIKYSGSSTTRLWDVSTGKHLGSWSDIVVRAWSNNGRYFISGSQSDQPYVFDNATQENILTFPDPSFRWEAEFSPNNNLAAYSTGIRTEPDNDDSHEYEYIFMVHDLVTGEEILNETIKPVREKVWASYIKIAFSADSRYIAGASVSRIDIWDLAAQEIVVQFPLDVSWPEIVLFSPDNSYISVSGFNGTQIWNLAENKETLLEDHLHGLPQALRFSADGQYLTGTKQEKWGVGEGGSWYEGQNRTQVWDVVTGKEILHLPEVDADAAFMGETHHLLTINKSGTIQIWDVDTQNMLMQSQLNTQRTTRIHPSGNQIASIDRRGQIRILSPESFLTTRTLYPMTVSENYRPLGNLSLLVYTPDGFTLATASWDGPVRLWDTETGQEQDAFGGGDINDLAFNPESTHIIISGGNSPSPAPNWEPEGYTYIRTISNGQTIPLTNTHHVHDSHVRDVVYAPNGRTFATVSNLAQLWDAATGEEIWTCAPELVPLKLFFTPDGDRLIVLTKNKIVICDVTNGEILQQFLPQTNSRFWEMAADSNGRYLAIAETNSVQIWDLETETLIKTSPSKNDRRTKLLFSSNSLYLGILSDHVTQNRRLIILETETWQPVSNRTGSINDFAFSPDSNYLASTNHEGTTRILTLADGQEINQLQEDEPRTQLIFRPDGKQIALLGQQETVLLWMWNPEDWVIEACARLGDNSNQICPRP